MEAEDLEIEDIGGEDGVGEAGEEKESAVEVAVPGWLRGGDEGNEEAD